MQHARVAPLPTPYARCEFPFENTIRRSQPAERGGDHADTDTQAIRKLLGPERDVSPGEPRDKIVDRTGRGGEKGLRQPGRGHDPDGVAVPAGVFGSDVALISCDPHRHDAAGDGERVEPVVESVVSGVDGGWFAAGGQFRAVEIPEGQQQFVHRVGVLDGIPGVEPLQFEGQLFEHGGFEQFAELGVSEQFAELGMVERERRGPAFGERGVAFVEEIGRVIEHQRRREGRRPGRLDRMQANRPLLDPRENLLQAAQIEHVAEAFAVGFQQDRKLFIPRRRP